MNRILALVLALTAVRVLAGCAALTPTSRVDPNVFQDLPPRHVAVAQAQVAPPGNAPPKGTSPRGGGVIISDQSDASSAPRQPTLGSAAPTPARTVIQLRPSYPGHTTIAAVWEVTNPEFLKKITKTSSRGLTKSINEGITNGSITPYLGSGNAKFSVYDLKSPDVAGSHVGLNVGTLGHGTVLPQTVAPPQNATTLPLQNGEARLTVERRVVGPASRRTTELIDLPPGVVVVHRGPVQHSCGLESNELCDNGPAQEWFRQVHELKWQWSRVNFFVMRPKR